MQNWHRHQAKRREAAGLSPRRPSLRKLPSTFAVRQQLLYGHSKQQEYRKLDELTTPQRKNAFRYRWQKMLDRDKQKIDSQENPNEDLHRPSFYVTHMRPEEGNRI